MQALNRKQGPIHIIPALYVSLPTRVLMLTIVCKHVTTYFACRKMQILPKYSPIPFTRLRKSLTSASKFQTITIWAQAQKKRPDGSRGIEIAFGVENRFNPALKLRTKRFTIKLTLFSKWRRSDHQGQKCHHCRIKSLFNRPRLSSKKGDFVCCRCL